QWAARLGLAHDGAFDDRVNTLYRAASLASLTGYDDNAEALAALRQRGIAIGLATNDSEQNARAHLSALGIEHWFDFVAGYDSGHGAKPGPGMVIAFARHVGVAPSAIALVGDSTHDIDAARAAGALGIGIARTKAAADALGTHADHRVDDLDALLALLGTPSED
ncbi:MAG: HAD family hydrolase, partial [Hyphomicrobiales bacterium]